MDNQFWASGLKSEVEKYVIEMSNSNHSLSASKVNISGLND